MTTPTQITFTTPPPWVGNEYSSMSPFNCDNTRLLLIRVDHFGLYDGNGKFLMDLAIPASAEPRWSRTDPKTLYYLSGNTLYEFSLATHSPLHMFTEYVSISGKGESDISIDGDHLVLSGVLPDSSVDVFVFQISTATKLSVFHFPATKAIDGLKILPSNLAVISYADGTGIWVLDNPPRKIANVDGHACPATYQGRDVLLWCSSADPQVNKNAVCSIDVATGIMDVLWECAWAYAFHISAPAALPYCFVSTDCPDKSLPSQVWQVFYDKTVPPVLVCEPGSIYTGYNSQVKAAVSWDGSHLVGCSNFGKTADVNYCDSWMVQLAQLTPDASAPPQGATQAVPSTETDKYGEQWLNMGSLAFIPNINLLAYDYANKAVSVLNQGSLPYDWTSDLVDFNPIAKNITVYRRK
jgi:hypothetical protein